MQTNKTHYRKVFKSDHLGAADLEEMIEEKKELVFTIKMVKQEFETKVAGKKINANIAYFEDGIKPLVLNATNSRIMAKITDSKFVEDWAGIVIELFIDHTVKMKGEVVGGVRIKGSRIDWAAMTDLFEIKKDSIPSNYFDNIERIVSSKDDNSYFKALKYLKSL